MNIGGKKIGTIRYNMNSMLKGGGLQSTLQRQERKEKSEKQIAFFESKKADLKNRECATLEEIERKLEMFHTYEDGIAAAKAAYNSEQAFHILDEAEEQGEKNAEAVKKHKPKTPEEREKELAKEALGLDEDKGILSEVLDEMQEAVEEMAESGEALEKLEQCAQKEGLQMNGELEGMEEWTYRRFDARA